MKYTVNDKQYQGTPDEISNFICLMQAASRTTQDPGIEAPNPFENIVSESERLRQELARDANFNPYGGVVPSKEAEQDINIKKSVTADQDTGVELI